MLIGLSKPFLIVCFFQTLTCTYLQSQIDFNSVYEHYYPKIDTQNPDSVLADLIRFEKQVAREASSLQLILAKMYLSEQLASNGKYEQAMTLLLEGEELAEKLNHKLLKGRISYKKGEIQTNLNNYEAAIELFEKAATICKTEKDSQYLAIAYEQLAALYGYKKETEVSTAYYKNAIRLLKKYWPVRDLAIAYSNYGNVLSMSDSSEKAIRYYRKAKKINESNGYTEQLVPSLQNLADELYYADSLNQALLLLRKANKLNEENNWPRYQVVNYSIQSKLFEAYGELDSAIFYLKRKLELSDTIMGPSVQVKIAELNSERELRKKKSDLDSKSKEIQILGTHNKNLFAGILIVSFSLLLLSILIIFLKRKNRKVRNESRESMNKLKELLNQKKVEIENFRQNTTSGSGTSSQQRPVNIPISTHNLRILTPDDWTSFKRIFNKTYPGLLRKIRLEYPNLTEAEERLFLLLLLNLRSNELTNILGVQKDTIKKTRSRLRKKLNLATRESLETFIQHYILTGTDEGSNKTRKQE